VPDTSAWPTPVAESIVSKENPSSQGGVESAVLKTATVLGGADAVRVHDVDAARDVVNVARALARD